MKLVSKIDKSVNFIEEQLIGFIESRYVRKTDEYFITYISSQTGCNRGCKFCHLTTTNQTQFKNCDLPDFLKQAAIVFEHYENSNQPAKYVNFNFMARGEALANPTIIENSFSLLSALGSIAQSKNLFPRFNLSTIMPVTLKKSLAEIFPIITPTIYYSMYSVNPEFRKHWMPAAMNVDSALENIREYQLLSKKIVKFHCAFIAGENDSDDDVYAMMQKIRDYDIKGEFNIVHYNSASPEQGEESDRLDRITDIIKVFMPVKTIPRVGRDVFASCGRFYE